MIARSLLVPLLALSTSCVTTGESPVFGLGFELPAPQACRAFKASALVAVGGMVTVAGLAANDVFASNSPLPTVGLAAAVGGVVATGLTSRGCFSQMNRAAERATYRPPEMTPEQKTELDRVRTEEQTVNEQKPCDGSHWPDY